MLELASLTIAENLFAPILSITSSICSAKKSAVWLWSDKFLRLQRYSRWSEVCITKFQIDSFAGFDHPSHANYTKEISKRNNL